MSRAFLFSLPTHGHVNPTLPLVAELQRRGEHIVYYTNDPFREKVEAAGAEFRSYHSNLSPTQDLGGPFGLMYHSMAATEALLPTLLAHAAAEQPDYLILDSACLWGNLLQQRLACPAVVSCTTFAMNNKVFGAMSRDPGPKPPLGGMLRGLPMLFRYLRLARRVDRRFGTRSPGLSEFFLKPQALNLVFSSRYFQPQADSFGASFKFVGPSVDARHESTDFPLDQLGAEPVIYISMGTIFNNLAAFYRTCFQAFAGSPYKMVLSIGSNVDERVLGEPPANFIVRRYVPQVEILKRAALFITHGGMNSVSEAFLHDVPLLVLPQVGDQFLVAQRVQALGAGLAAEAARVTAPELAALAERLLVDAKVKQQARAIGDSLRATGGAKQAADEIALFKQRFGLPA